MGRMCIYTRRLPLAAAILVGASSLGCDEEPGGRAVVVGDAGDRGVEVDADLDRDRAPEADAGAEVDAAAEPDAGARSDAAAEPDAAVEPDMSPDAGPPLGRFEAVDRCLSRVIETSGATGIAVAIVEDGALVHAAGIGHRNDPMGTPVEPTTLFRFGSTLKGMTALAVFTAVERGAIDLDAPIVELLPALAEHDDARWQVLTLHHLLTHQGGLFDHIGLQEPGEPDSVLGEVVESAAFARGAYFMVDPGTFYNYSNPNFMLAGRALEVATGEVYREAMQGRVFAPLGMRRVLFRPADVIADGDYAWGSTAGPLPGLMRSVPADEYDSVWGRPAGLGWASVLDLARYVGYVIDGGPLADAMAEGEPWAPPVEAATWAEWRTGQVQAESFGVRVDYAHGLMVEEGLRLPSGYREVATIGHGGNINGYTSVLITLPALGFGATVLANGDALNGPLRSCLTPAIETNARLPASVEAPDRRPEPERFVDYVGEYIGGPNIGALIVELGDDGGLDIELPLADAAGVAYERRLRPVARDMFLLSIQGFALPFSGMRADPDGPVRYLRTRAFVGHRVDADEPAMQKRAPDVTGLRRWLERASLFAEPAPVTARPER